MDAAIDAASTSAKTFFFMIFAPFSIVTAHRAVNFSGITDISCRIYLLFVPRLNCRVLILFILKKVTITPVPVTVAKHLSFQIFLIIVLFLRAGKLILMIIPTTTRLKIIKLIIVSIPSSPEITYPIWFTVTEALHTAALAINAAFTTGIKPVITLLKPTSTKESTARTIAAAGNNIPAGMYTLLYRSKQPLR